MKKYCYVTYIKKMLSSKMPKNTTKITCFINKSKSTAQGRDTNWYNCAHSLNKLHFYCINTVIMPTHWW